MKIKLPIKYTGRTISFYNIFTFIRWIKRIVQKKKNFY